VLVLAQARLVVLLTPKTGSQSLAAALAPHALPAGPGVKGRHIGATRYARDHAAAIAEALGELPRTLAVMRAPVDRLGSWFRYRARQGVADPAKMTAGLSFAEFVAATLEANPPSFARIGRQDQFLGLAGQGPPVDLIVDFARMDLLEAHLSDALGLPVRLPHRNVSPGDPPDLTLPLDLIDRFRAARSGEFALYDRVSASGLLETAVLSSSAR